ncbi:hypothetical protein AN958_06564 [Leucoagaricus sp. SymC.cos]|nr:hypothetical protein AN958_06564 [Leucoagaricus sp. SymC.cos]
MSVSQLVSPIYEPFTAPLAPAPMDGGYFAFANIRGAVSLVQVSDATPASGLSPVDVKIFRHEFINIFRFSEARTLHPADLLSKLESIDDSQIHYEEDKETVYLAKELVGRVRNANDPRFSMTQQNRYRVARVHRRQR